MKVSLANINLRPLFDPVTGRDSQESLGLKYLAACAAEQGHRVRVVDAQFRNLQADVARQEILADRPEVVALSLSDWVLTEACEWVACLREILPEAFFCAGGPGPSSWWAELLTGAAELDAVVLGEGERTFETLLAKLQQGCRWQDTAGIAYRGEDNLPRRNPPQPFIEDLDALPFPSRERRYPFNSATLSASRGCFGNCSFCDIRTYSRSQPGRAVRYRTPPSVLAEMEQLYRQQGVRRFNFVDDIFTGIDRLQPGWTGEIADGIRDRGMDVALFCQSRADDIREPSLTTLKRAGLRTIAIGIESCSRRTLGAFHKGTTQDENSRAIRLVQRLKIHYELFSILVEADTTPQEMTEDIRFFVEHNYLQQNDPIPFSVQAIAFRAYPFRHTPLYEQYKDRGILHEKDFTIVYALQHPGTRRILQACQALHTRVAEPLTRALNFSYVNAIQGGDLAAAVREKRYGNQFLEADHKFMMDILHVVTQNPEAPEPMISALVDRAAERIQALSG